MALYDPNEFPEASVNLDFTVADVLAWARTKPADEAYDYCSNGQCAVAQFVRETGRCRNPSVAPNWWINEPRSLATGDYSRHMFDDRVRAAAIGSDDADKSSWTFGQFAKRLESALA